MSNSENLDLSTVHEATICAISRHPRRQDRYFLRLESGLKVIHKLLITDEAVVQFGLTVGEVIHMERLARLAELAASVRAFDLAVNSLAQRARSRHELGMILRRKGVAVIHIDQTLDRLTALGVLNDEQFARTFARGKVLGPGKSVMVLRRDLGRKGVSRDIADAAITEVMREQDVDETGIARAVAAKRWRALGRLEPVVARRRLIGFLQRRGFSGEVIRTVVREVTSG